MTLDDTTQIGLERLNALLPLAARQRALAPAARELHRAVLRHFVTRGAAPSRTVLATQIGDADLDALLAALAEGDLIVLDERGEIVGAYPVTTESTPHRIQVNGHWIHAMCAVDAMAVAPMYDTHTRVESVCHVTGTPVRVEQHGAAIVQASPSADLRVGIHWQETGALCRPFVVPGNGVPARRPHRFALGGRRSGALLAVHAAAGSRPWRAPSSGP